MENKFIFEGSLSVKAVIQAKKRQVMEIRIDESKKDKDTGFILSLAKQNHIPVQRCSRSEIDEVAQGKTHGGVICFAGDRVNESYASYTDKENAFFCILEGIEDPYNFGYCLRSLYAAGCDCVLVNPRNWSTAADVVCKSSAGASEFISIVMVEDMSAALNELKAKGFHLYCAQRSDAKDMYEVAYSGKMILGVGGEMRGLSKAVLNHSDQNIYIPYANSYRNALNASSATSVLAFEIYRQRNHTLQNKNID